LKEDLFSRLAIFYFRLQIRVVSFTDSIDEELIIAAGVLQTSKRGTQGNSR